MKVEAVDGVVLVAYARRLRAFGLGLSDGVLSGALLEGCWDCA